MYSKPGQFRQPYTSARSLDRSFRPTISLGPVRFVLKPLGWLRCASGSSRLRCSVRAGFDGSWRIHVRARFRWHRRVCLLLRRERNICALGATPTSASGDGSSSPQVLAIPDEDSIRLGPYPVAAPATLDNHAVDREFFGCRILYGHVGSDPKFVQLLGVLIMSTRSFRDVPFALYSSVVFAPLPSRIEGSPVRGQSVLDRPAK